MIPPRMQAMPERISAAIFFGRNFNSGKQPWSVNLTYNHEMTKVEITEHGTDFDEAMLRAWTKLDTLVSKGLGSAAMMPALEAPKSEMPPNIAVNPDDDIPF